MIRALTVVALVLAALAGTSTAQASGPKDACKHGGFAGYVDPSTDRPFANQGGCVSFVNGGGTLVSVDPPPPMYDPVIEAYDVSEPFEGNWDPAWLVPYSHRLRLSDFAAGEVVTITYRRGGSPDISGTETFTLDSQGALDRPGGLIAFCNQQELITATSGDLSASVVVPEPASCPVRPPA